MDDLFLRALRSEAVERPPVWIMRQAGRYLPEYRALREKHTLSELFHDPKLSVEVTWQPLRRFGFDAAILFSDILVLAEPLGLTISFPERGGPCVEPFLSPDQIPSYTPVSKTLWYVFETIRSLKQQLTVPLIGFSGAPFTLACYFMDRSYNRFGKVKEWIKKDPKALHALLCRLTDLVISYLLEQQNAGVDAIQIFDSCADLISEKEWKEFSAPYLNRILRALSVPTILFAKASSLRVASMVALAPSCISFDWHQPIDVLRSKVPRSIAVQGNFNPALLLSSCQEIESTVDKALASMRCCPGWIVNLGHGITPDVPVEHVECFVRKIKA
ncbi:MAG: uroporphyrinogen decarboxylase [Chlamydiota bacterium]|jgi:uroporphyrinogen decarboxylase